MLRIVVSGLAATYPLGGVFWDYLQYVVGFQRLGHDVLYVEDCGKWCYDPRQQTFVEDSESNAAYLARHIALLDPDSRDAGSFATCAGRLTGADGSRWPSFAARPIYSSTFPIRA